MDCCALHVVHEESCAIVGHVDARTARVLACLLLRPDFVGVAVRATLPNPLPSADFAPVPVVFDVTCSLESAAAVKDFVWRCGYAVTFHDDEDELAVRDVAMARTVDAVQLIATACRCVFVWCAGLGGEPHPTLPL